MVRRVQSSAADVDRQVHMFRDLMAGHGGYVGPPDEEIRFARVFNKGLDMHVTAHHMKIFAKYSQLLHREGSERSYWEDINSSCLKKTSRSIPIGEAAVLLL